jgi:hypothetical protein
MPARAIATKSPVPSAGPSPGTTYRLAVHAGLVAVDDLKNPDLDEALAGQWLVAVPSANVVPPGGGCNQQHSQGMLSAEQAGQLAAGDKWLTLIGAIFYTGPSGDHYETGLAYACKVDGILRVIGTPKVNYMK